MSVSRGCVLHFAMGSRFISLTGLAAHLVFSIALRLVSTLLSSMFEQDAGGRATLHLTVSDPRINRSPCSSSTKSPPRTVLLFPHNFTVDTSSHLDV